MKYSLIIESFAGIKDYAETITNVEYITNRNGQPSRFRFTVLKTGLANFHEGDRVTFSYNNQVLFVGTVFNKTRRRSGEIAVVCYDQLRYLKKNGRYIFEGVKASDILRQICEEYGIQLGTVEDTEYAIPTFIKEDKECLDIINQAIELTSVANNKRYVLYDDAGKICLRDIANLKLNVVLGDKSYVYDFEYTTDIDKDTYNQIKLTRPNESTGNLDTYIYYDSGTIARWGLLEYYEEVDEQLNEAQIDEKAKLYLSYFNRVTRQLKMDSIGIPGIRAGQMLPVIIPEIGDISISNFVTIDTCTHRFTQNDHSMSLSMQIYLDGEGEYEF